MVTDAPARLEQLTDQRQAQRHPLSQSAVVSVLGAADQVFQGEIRNVSKGGTQLQLVQPLATGSLLRIEYDNSLLLGEVVYCHQEQAGWLVGVRIEHALTGLAALSDAMRGLG
jgi:PilZ domain